MPAVDAHVRPQRHDDARARLRFIQEAQITARLEHPGIVPVCGLGIDEQGRPFSAMRFVDGETPRDDTSLPPGECLLQLFGDEFPVATVGSYLYWGPAVGRVVPESRIDVTLRVSIRQGNEQWRADVFTSAGRADIWVRMQPVPLPPF